MKNRLLVFAALLILSCQKSKQDTILRPAQPVITKEQIKQNKFWDSPSGINDVIPGEVNVRLKDNSRVGLVFGRTQTKFNLPETMKARGHNGYHKIIVPKGTEKEVARELSYNPNVEWATPVYVVKRLGTPDDTYWNNESLWGLKHIKADSAWASGNFGNKEIHIAVTDEGIFSHDDLCPNIWSNPFEIPNDSIDNDGNGYVDDNHGWNFKDKNNQIYMGGDKHGTHVAGTIGAKGGNGFGVIGVNSNVTLISTKFLQGFGTSEDAMLANYYIADLVHRHGIKIVGNNNSWGGGGFDFGYMESVRACGDAGILNIYAAGNANINNDLDPSQSFPGGFTHLDSTMIGVIATDWQNNKAFFSSFGQTSAHIGAPGTGIVSTVPTNEHTSSYDFYSGTSMAAPHVTGSIGLYYGIHMELFSMGKRARALAVKDALLSAATRLPQLYQYCREGRFLNVASFLGQTIEHPAGNECPIITPDNNPPSTPVLEMYDIGFDPTPGAFYGGYVGLRWTTSIDPEGNPVVYPIWVNGVHYTTFGGTIVAIAGIKDTTEPTSFRIYAVDSWGNPSGWSNEVIADWSTLEVPPPPPPPPTECTIVSNNLNAVSQGLTVNLTWTVSNSGCTIASSRLERKKGVNGTYSAVAFNPVSPHQDNVQTPGSYTYRVMFQSSTGQTFYSNERNIQVKKK